MPCNALVLIPFAMPDTSDFRNGLTLVRNGDLWTIVEFLHVKPGKGGAFVRSKLRQVRSGKVVDHTFRAGEKVETARIERRPHQFLYQDDLGLHMMDTQTYEQFSLPEDRVEGRDFLMEGVTVDILFHAEAEKPLNVELPGKVDLTVVNTDPGVRGDTATGGAKPAIMESGAVVLVPLFIDEGDIITVNTQTGEYVTRAATADKT